MHYLRNNGYKINRKRVQRLMRMLENDGRKQSRDMDYWLDAEKAVMAQIKEQYSKPLL